MALFEEQLGEWKPVSRIGGIAWLVFYGLFFLYAFTNTSGFLFLDFANLMIHEAGHFFFSWFGETIHILGGTLGELIVPVLCAAYFFWQRQTTAFTFCIFWFFENFPYIGAYMSDARTASKPLVGGDESDWTILFSKWDLLARDQQIGYAMRVIGLLGMLVAPLWLAYRVRQSEGTITPRPFF